MKKKSSNAGNTDPFDPQAFLDTAGVSRKVAEFRRGESIFSQGDGANTVMYIQRGGVKLSVVNGSGKEAVVAMFGPADFFGEGCMAGQALRMATATAIAPTTLLVVNKNEMLRVLHEEHELSDRFIGYISPTTFAWKKTWSINSLTPARSVWPELSSCSPVMVNKIGRTGASPKSHRKPWPK